MGTEQVIRGVTVFHSETGTEGGYWAMQDEKFMHLENSQLRCSRCGRCWNGEGSPPAASFSYWVEEDDRRSPEGYLYASGFHGFDEPHPELPLGRDGKVDSWIARMNAASQECYDNDHREWVPLYPDGMWSYDGLHVLDDGDHLTVFEQDGVTVKWDGIINLQRHRLFTEDASGMWIHADQCGQDRDAWAALFLEQHPCELRPKESS